MGEAEGKDGDKEWLEDKATQRPLSTPERHIEAQGAHAGGHTGRDEGEVPHAQEDKGPK